MKKLRLLWRVLKTTQADKIMTGFLGFILLSALAFTIVEPNIKNYGDGLWYCFSVFTTVGFGDLVAISLLGRILTVLLGLYGIFVVALIPAIVVNYYLEISKMKTNDSMAEFLDQLMRLPDLSKEELTRISQKVKKKINKL